MQQQFAIIDPSAGISGDMLLGALVDAGAPAEWLRALPGRLGLHDVTVDIASVSRCGIRATKVTVRGPGGGVEGPADVEAPGPAPEAAHHHHAPHRHLAELIRLIEGAPLSPETRERAVRAFRLVAEAEGRVHGLPPERVALHEVGAADALVDIVGAIEGFERLGVDAIHHRPVAVGAGWVETAHGQLPVPAPATALLLEGLEVTSGGPVRGEATTPTGAALVRVLSAGPPPDRWRVISSGWGAGARDPREYPNALRILLAEPAAEAGQVSVLSTDMDDLSPEYVEPLRQAILAAGALDVQTWSVQMKKGRTGFRCEIVVDEPAVEAVTAALFLHSTTGGLRRVRAERVTLPRRQVTVRLHGDVQVRVKVLEVPAGGAPRVKPEYDDVLAAAQALGQAPLEVARAAQRGAEALIANTKE